MGMHHRLALLVADNVAVEGGDFHLLIDPDHLESLHRPVGPADHRRAEGADGLEMRIGEVVLAGEFRQAGSRGVALLEGDVEGAGPLAKVLVAQRSARLSPASWAIT